MLTPATSEYPNSVSGPTIYTSLIVQVEFHIIFSQMYYNLISHTGITPNEALKYDLEISNWQESVPPYFQENAAANFSFHWLASARYRVSWRVRCLRILIFTPVFLRWVGDNKGQDWTNMTEDEQRCLLVSLDYAHQNVISVRRYFQQEPQSVMGDWYAL